ncbi:MAG: phage holin family protein [Elstera sp.]
MGLLAGIIGFSASDLRRRAAILTGGLILGGVFLVVALAFLCVGLYLILSAHLGPRTAAFLIAGVGFLLALLVFACVAMALRRTQRMIDRAVRASVIASLAPPVLSLATRHVGLVSAVIAAGIAFFVIRRR